MLRKVYLSGAYSAGKTTLFESLKNQLQIENLKLIYCQEVARKIANEKQLSSKDFEDKKLTKEILSISLDEQVQQELELEEKEANNNVLAIFDRGAIDFAWFVATLLRKSFEDVLQSRPKVSKNVQSLREDDCLVFIIEPVSKFFEFDGVRPERYMTFENALFVDKAMRDAMNSLQIPFVRIQVEDLQERVDFVMNEVFKHWPDLKQNF